MQVSIDENGITSIDENEITSALQAYYAKLGSEIKVKYYPMRNTDELIGSPITLIEITRTFKFAFTYREESFYVGDDILKEAINAQLEDDLEVVSLSRNTQVDSEYFASFEGIDVEIRRKSLGCNR